MVSGCRVSFARVCHHISVAWRTILELGGACKAKPAPVRGGWVTGGLRLGNTRAFILNADVRRSKQWGWGIERTASRFGTAQASCSKL